LDENETYVIDFYGDDLHDFDVRAAKEFKITDTGDIRAEGGYVLLQGPEDVLGSVVNMEGTINAYTIELKEGFVRLSSSIVNSAPQSCVSVSSNIDNPGGRAEINAKHGGQIFGKMNLHGGTKGGYFKLYGVGWHANPSYTQMPDGYYRGTVNYDPKFLVGATTGDPYMPTVNNQFGNNPTVTTTIAVAALVPHL